MTALTDTERLEIATILKRRANEIAGFKQEHSCECYPAKPLGTFVIPASVEYALELEITRLRNLEAKIRPEEKHEDGE